MTTPAPSTPSTSPSTSSRTIRVVAAAFTSLVLTATALGAPQPARARPAPDGSLLRGPAGAPPAVSPRKPMVRERTTYAGKLPKGARPVVLQRKAGRTWKAVAKGRATASGRYRLTLAGRAGTYRVSAPAAGPVRAVSTRPVKVRTARQTVRLLDVGAPFVIGSTRNVVVKVSPARAGRTVVLQRRDGARWTTLDRARTTPSGRATLAHDDAAEAGSSSYRVLARPFRRSTSASSTPAPIRTVDAIEHLSAGGPDGNVSYDPSISGDGRLVAFTSKMPLLPGDSDVTEDVYVFDRVTGVLSLELPLISGHVNNPFLSHDGRFLAFQTLSPDLADEADSDYDVFVLDRRTGEVDLVSATPDGDPAAGNSYVYAISGNGSRVAFTSTARDLVELLPPPAGPELRHAYLRDRPTDATRALDRKGLGWSSQSIYGLDLSADGSRVAFSSSDLDLDPGQVNGSAIHAWTVAADGSMSGRTNLTPGVNAGGPVLSRDGSSLAFTSTNGLDPDDDDALRDAYLRLPDGDIEAVGPVLDGLSEALDISASGRWVLVATDGVVPDDTNGDDRDILLWDSSSGAFGLMTAAGPGDSGEGTLAAAGDVAALASRAVLRSGSEGGANDVFVVVAH